MAQLTPIICNAFSGLSDIYEMFMLDVSGASAIPVTKLFGRSPAGMNATGESDMMNYYDGIEEQQQAALRPIIDKLLPLMCMSEFGAVPDDLDFEFEPVRRPSEEERKQILTQTTEAVERVYNAGIISQYIALKELRESSRATGMWTNITDEDIEKADREFGIGGEAPDIMRFTEQGQTERSEQRHEESEGERNTPPATAGEPSLLNGAQITSLVGLVQSISSGDLPRDSGLAIMKAGFGFDDKQAQAILGGAGEKGRV